jgi:elongation factor P--(R)-beta-lysine ligase
MQQNWSLSRKRQALHTRAGIIATLRDFFSKEGYLEVDTPLLIPAPAPESHINAIPAGDGFLQTSPEICMKRLLAAGYEKIFQICHCWRAGERGKSHLPEFTMLEWYCSHADYRDLMDDCEALLRFVNISLGRGETIHFRGQQIDLAGPWERLSVRDAFRRYTSATMEGSIAAGTFDELMVVAIEPNLGTSRPCFLCDYPAERSALARLRQDDPTVAERFELYIAGVELANAFSELTEPVEQRERFLAEKAYRARAGLITYPLPENFLDEMAAMPPAAGIALGVDRLIMVLADAAAIDEVVAFTPETL